MQKNNRRKPYKIKEQYRTIEFPKLKFMYNFPMEVPLPRIGEVIFFNAHQGIVKNIIHTVDGEIHDIKIVVNT